MQNQFINHKTKSYISHVSKKNLNFLNQKIIVCVVAQFARHASTLDVA